MVSRVFVEKKPGFDGAALALASELRTLMGLENLQALRMVNRYDVEGISEELFNACVPTVFSEPQSDIASVAQPEANGATVFAVEALPGQFDQRADSAAECVQLISQGERPLVRCATLYYLEGDLSVEEIEAVKHYLINPVETREARLEQPETLKMTYPEPADVEVVEGFRTLPDEELGTFISERGLAMDGADLKVCRDWFVTEERDPTITEIKVIDTYWSDHCRHTTFGTQLEDVAIEDPEVAQTWELYQGLREELARQGKPVCLMDMGTIGAKALKARGLLTDLDESDEINACTVKCKVDVDGEEEEWLYLFKNETHNHPTEIEPFGGAATCVGGAIRDPLSGRSYVYQAMRITGAADPLTPIADTLPGKLPQRKLVTTAAAGYSSYGNQIGLATGQVHELYHPGYAAKHMEIGAVVGATPADHVRRETPAPGDVVVLLGGGTGRDGIGGATGSSKSHTAESIETCGAEVQKGNAPMERKIQRLFRRGDAASMIKRCNDFGAGGVSVAVGELADGVYITLDAVPKKYDGLDGTELAISESQERMAAVLAAEDVDAFIALAQEENLQAVPIATITEDPRMVMTWRGKTIVDLSRAFLASNGAPKYQDVVVEPGGAIEALPGFELPESGSFAERLASVVTDLNVASNKGLSERFDSTIGAATVLMPFGGTRQLTPSMAMVAKFPVEGETTTCSGLAWGYNPYLTEAHPYVGAYLAVVESLAKLIAAGFERRRSYFTFQEYFGALRGDALRWGKPVAAVLGALAAQMDLGVGAIGGKDSMSGSFEDLDVPPTLVSFATAVGSVDRVTSPEFKEPGHEVILLQPVRRAEEEGAAGETARNAATLLPNKEGLLKALDAVEALIGSGDALAVATPGFGGLAECLFKMTLGNGVGFTFAEEFARQKGQEALFTLDYGSFVVELAPGASVPEGCEELSIELLGTTSGDYTLTLLDETVDLAELQEAWESKLESVYPYRSDAEAKAAAEEVPQISWTQGCAAPSAGAFKKARPRVIIPVFPGNNCEFDSARAFERAGAEVQTLIVNNLTPQAVAESADALAQAIHQSQIVMIPGGFSGGDEPDGSAKFITAFFRSPQVTEAVRDLLQQRDGLMLGICNGFQALVKLGLVPFGDIRPMDEDCPTLTFNTIGRHQSCLVHTRVDSNLSPWFSRCEVGDIHRVAISHGEGRFVAPPALLEQMIEAGQIATQYVDAQGIPSMDLAVNPNGSLLAIEGITSPDGRILGKMGHSERAGAGLYRNIPDAGYQPIFEGGVAYFTD